MKEIGDYYGGWIKTEESTLKNHLKWARTKVKGSPELILEQWRYNMKDITILFLFELKLQQVSSNTRQKIVLQKQGLLDPM